jgi:hypothetical protein
MSTPGWVIDDLARLCRIGIQLKEGDATMRVLGAMALLASMLLCRAAMSQSVFDGTWRPDPQVFGPTRKSDKIELVNGVYDCRTCTPPYKIKADGTDRPIKGNPYYDTLRVSVVDERTIQTVAKKGGKQVAETRKTVSVDGELETDVQTVHFLGPRPFEITMHSKRVSPGPKGSHGISGEWRMTDQDVSNHAEDTIFRITGETLSMSDRMGRSFSAKLDGTEAPYSGSEEFTSVSLKLIDSNTIEESDKRDGKVVKVSLWAVGPDGRTMHVRFDDTRGHTQEQIGHKISDHAEVPP